jgi:hypothetical protein
LRVIRAVSGMMMGRRVRVWAEMGVMAKQREVGVRMGPPQERD